MNPIFVCMESEVAENCYRVVDVYGTEVVIAREDGKLKAAPNRCRHRGFPAAEGIGCLPIRCRYHGQRFDFGDPYVVKSYGGLVFVGDREFFLEPFADMLLTVAAIDQRFGTIRTTVKAPWHLWAQNTMDPHHLRFVHPGFVKNFVMDPPYDVRLGERITSYRMRVNDETKRSYQRFGLSGIGDFLHILVFPNLSLTCFLNAFISVESITPTPEGCEVITRFFNTVGGPRSEALNRAALAANKRILQEDREIVETWARTWDPDRDNQWLPGEERIRDYLEKLRREDML